MQEVRALVDAQLTETGIEHRISRGHMVHTSLIGSPLQLRQIMVNLFSNAIKYNKDVILNKINISKEGFKYFKKGGLTTVLFILVFLFSMLGVK